MRDFSKTEIAKIKQAIDKKARSFPQEWLGRALAYTPYQPRPLNLKKSIHFTPQNLYGFSENLFAESQRTDSNGTQIMFLQIAKNYEKEASGFLIESLEILTYIRRYVSLPLIYDFLILDSYQLLESLVYGADGVILLPKFLTQAELKDLSDYAIKIGLERIFRIESKEDLTKAIFAKADILDLSSNLSLIPLIPNNKIILSEIPQEIPKNQENDYKALDARILRV